MQETPAPLNGKNGNGVNPWVIAPLVALAAFMEVLDISIANVSLLHIAGSLSVSQDEATWVLTSYTVTNGIVIPLSGWLSSTLGRKRYFLICILGFSFTSLMCGLAPSIGVLVAFRALQGIMGGGLQPASQAILADAFPPSRRSMAFALYGMSVVFAPAIGPTLGGWITDHFSWRWVFLINVPIGLLLYPLINALVKDPRHLVEARKARKAAAPKTDYIGFGLLALGLGSLQIVLDRGQQDDWWSSPHIVVLAIAAAAGLLMFVIWEWHDRDPIVDVHMFRDKNFAVSNLLMFIFGFILLGSTAILPLYVQSLMGYTATDAGMVLTPGGFTVMLLMPLVARLLTKVPTRLLIAWGFMVTASSLLYMTQFSLQTDFETILWARVLQASGFAFLFIPVNTAAFETVGPDKSSSASAMINMARNIGGSVGISLSATLLARREQFHQSRLHEVFTSFNDAYHQQVDTINRAILHLSQGLSLPGQSTAANGILYQEMVRQANMLAYLDIFRIMALLFVLLIPVIFLLRKGTPSMDDTGFHHA